jgi:hypothetical protein
MDRRPPPLYAAHTVQSAAQKPAQPDIFMQTEHFIAGKDASLESTIGSLQAKREGK